MTAALLRVRQPDAELNFDVHLGRKPDPGLTPTPYFVAFDARSHAPTLACISRMLGRDFCLKLAGFPLS